MAQKYKTLSALTLVFVLLELDRSCGSQVSQFEFGLDIGPGAVFPDDNDEQQLRDFDSTPVLRGRQRLISQLNEQRGFPRLDNRQRVEEILRPKPRCDRKIRVLNGATRIRDRGALVRFQCSYGYHMLGVGLAVCVKGRWSDPPPICVRDGCKSLAIPIQGNLRQLYGGGVAMFSCNYGHYLVGERVLTCDGTKWNGTAPNCIEIPPVTLSPPSTTFPTIPLEIASPEPEPELEDKTASLQPSEQPFNMDTSTFEPDLYTTSKSASTQQVESGSEVSSSTDDNWAESTMSSESAKNTEANTESTVPENPPETTPISVESSTKKFHTTTIETILQIPAVELPITSTTRAIFLIEEVTKQATTESPTTESVPPTTMTAAETETESSTNQQMTEETNIVLPTIPAETEEVTTTMEVPTTKIAMTTSTSTTTVPSTRPISTKTTTTNTPFIPRFPKRTTTEPTIDIKIYGYPTKRAYIRKEKDSRKLDMENETTKELIAISPEKLDNGHHMNPEHYNFAHMLIIAGTVLITIGFVSILGGVFMYCWRKNKGIARARGNDLDGRTLSYNEGNEEITWLDSRGNSGL